MRYVYSALTDEKFKNQIQFHMPGHLRGRGFENFAIDFECDVTELEETDNLHAPESVIKESLENAARVFGAEKAYYLVNGSTSGVLSMVLGFAGNGEKIIADRFCHKSFVSALALSGAVPVWVYPNSINSGTMWGGISPEKIEKAIRENPDAKAVYITAPNYFGIMGDVEKIARIVHENGMYLLIDGAHGAHYGMSELLPPSLISLGADAVCMSLHKTMPSLTQTAILLTNKRYERLEETLAMVQTSSPSYIFISSCEYATEYYEKCPKERWNKLYEWVKKYFPEQIEADEKSVKYKDFTRLNCVTNGNPYEVYEKLRKEYNIAAECSYGEGVVAILNTFHTEEEVKKLKEALDEINMGEYEKICMAPIETEAVKTPREAFFAKKKRVCVNEAVGKIAGEGIMVYPPGVYQILPGEVVTEEALENLCRLKEKGAQIPAFDESNILIFE